MYGGGVGIGGRSGLSSTSVLIARLNLEIENLRREL